MTLLTNPAPAERQLIDPRELRTAHKRWDNERFAGGRFYYAVLIGHQVYRARQTFRSAFDADVYAHRLKDRWIRLFVAAIRLNPELETNPLQD